MEGFDPLVFDTVLNLSKMELHTAVIIALGYRDEENDSLVKAKKVRLPLETFATYI